MRHNLEVHLANNTNVLLRVVALLRRRGLLVETLVVGPTADPAVSRLQAVVQGEPFPDQLRLQLLRQVEVLVAECEECADGTGEPRTMSAGD